ncbi:MAG: NYN domain-containing protein [Corynebacterium sp.]|uniref:NYN domain-containing protein n=1 Tax=Corynebacterium sp. TaxID=1720 RepID=UPI0026DCA9A6|nr:NYN domain-containing protein [Corynebacterium sp.]MDO5030211.1 NYN domain-containing protein [Corynebacterium sp.]
MLERTLVFVDTSYLLASFYNSWETGARGQLEIDLREVVSVLDRMITQQLNQPVQRQLWYDGIPESGPHRYQRSLRTIDGVQLRAGQLIEWGDRRTQKAVDTRLVADMVVAGLRNQVSDIVLVSGDADMLPGVTEASSAGVRVHLYGFGWDSMSGALRHACDSTTILDPREDFADAMQLNVLEGPIPPVVRTNKPLGDAEPIEDLGATRIPDTRITPPGEESLDDGHSATPSSGDGDPETSETGASEIQQEKRVVPSPTTESDSECIEFDGAAATPTAKADSPKFNEVEHAAKMGKREVPAEAERKAEVERTGSSGSSATSATPAAPATPAAMPGATEVSGAASETAAPTEAKADAAAGSDSVKTEPSSSGADAKPAETEAPKPSPRPNPSMMAPRRKLRSRYVPLPNEVWASAGFQTPFDVGQQYANWWYENIATEQARDTAHLLSGGGLPPEIDRPLLQFACETLHEYTLTETQRVNLRDGFHAGIRGVLLARKNNQGE